VLQIGFAHPWWDTLSYRAAQAPFTFKLEHGPAATDWISLGLTAALVWIAFLEIRRAKRAETATLAARKGRDRVAAVRVSAEAYNAQPRLASLLENFPGEIGGYQVWAAEVSAAKELSDNMNALLVLAGEASDKVFNDVEFVYNTFRKGKEEAEKCVESWGPTENIEIMKAHAFAARDLLQACSKRLGTLISPVLLAQVARAGVAKSEWHTPDRPT
jgi:hypothetical protein